LRSWQLSDLETLVKHANNRNVWLNVRDHFPHPYTRAAGEDWLLHATQQDPESNFAIDVDGNAVGGIGVMLQHDVAYRSGEVGYWLGEEYWGRGITTDALRAITDFALDKFHLCRIYALVFEWNLASCRVLEKAGYTLEARLRKSATKNGQTIEQLLFAYVTE